ncbi:unnamed protein product [Mytilus edulis]|uniref:WSC domain-containing protein n=1 Tax=Mytilus edulis TaxID=6550 RepID=A0A8S3V5X6_MYTED|nr:unnamed protein product [Mytilus edulis]
MENNLCLLYCKEQGYMYSGTEISDECHCGDDPYKYGPGNVSDYYNKPDFDCDWECRGDSEQICGGGWSYQCMQQKIDNSKSEVDSNDYVGCFVDTRTRRLLPHQYWLNGNNPPDLENNLCLLYCKEQGYMYFGTQNANQCFCGDDPYQYGPEDVSDYYLGNYDCNKQCCGDSEQICGGGWRLSVYETGYLPLKQGHIQYKLF